MFSIGEDGSSVLWEIFSFSGGSQSRVSKVWRGVIEDIPKGVMPFGYDSGDNFVCLDLTSGAIYWIDHETMEPIRISESISEFIQTMTKPEPLTMDLVEELGKEGSAEEVRKFLRIKKTNKLSNGGRSVAQEASRYGNLDALQVCFKEGENLSLICPPIKRTG